MNARADIKSGAASSALVLTLVRNVDGFNDLKDDWDRLYDRSGRSNPFLSYSWTRACFEAECQSPELFILGLRRAGELVAIAPMCIEHKFGFRVLRFISEDRSDYLGFLCEDELEMLEGRLLSELVNLSKDFDIALFRNLSAPFTTLHQSRKPRSFKWHQVQWTTSAYCASDCDWNSLHSNGPGWLKRMRNQRRRFEKDGHVIERFTGSDAVAQLNAVAKIEASSWKGRQGVARLQPGPGQDILRKAFLALDTQMELWLAFTGGEAIAFQIDFLTSERLWLYQFSYSEEFSKIGAGAVINYTSIERSWEDGVREYDYLIGDEPYKRSRTTTLRPVHYLAFHTNSLRGWLGYSMLVAPRWHLREVKLLKLLYSKLKELKRFGRLANRSNFASMPHQGRIGSSCNAPARLN